MTRRFSGILIFALVAILISPLTMAFSLSSSDFQNNGFIPQIYTCHGSNINPQLSWSGEPSIAKSYILILSDPDAPSGVWYHWIIYNIPAGSHAISRASTILPGSSIVLKNSWGNSRYDGPCPPSGTHHYWFTLYALNTTLNLSPDTTLPTLKSAMKNKIVGVAKIMGKVSQ